MAIGACFGSPMLNFLLGIGISCLYAIVKQNGEPFKLDVSYTVFISGIGVIFGLTFSLIWISLNGFRAGMSNVAM
jgi:sodium/potassium/calcium exchanger 6